MNIKNFVLLFIFLYSITSDCILPKYDINNISSIRCIPENHDSANSPSYYKEESEIILQGDKCKVTCRRGYFHFYQNITKTCPHIDENIELNFNCLSKEEYKIQKSCLSLNSTELSKNHLLSLNYKNSTIPQNTLIENGDEFGYTCTNMYHRAGDKMGTNSQICRDGKFLYPFRCRSNIHKKSIDYVGTNLKKADENKECTLGNFENLNIKSVFCRLPFEDNGEFYSAGFRIDSNSICKSVCLEGTHTALVKEISCNIDHWFSYLKCVDDYEISHNAICLLPNGKELSMKLIRDLSIKAVNSTKYKSMIELTPGTYIDKTIFYYNCKANSHKLTISAMVRCIRENSENRFSPREFGCECDHGYDMIEEECVKRNSCKLGNFLFGNIKTVRCGTRDHMETYMASRSMIEPYNYCLVMCMEGYETAYTDIVQCLPKQVFLPSEMVCVNSRLIDFYKVCKLPNEKIMKDKKIKKMFSKHYEIDFKPNAYVDSYDVEYDCISNAEFYEGSSKVIRCRNKVFDTNNYGCECKQGFIYDSENGACVEHKKVNN